MSFKVGCVKDQSLRFDQSFCIKKVCIDDSTIQRFCDGRVENVVCFLISVYYDFHFTLKFLIYSVLF